MHQQEVGTRMGLSVGIAQVEVFASAAAHAAVLEAEQATRIAAGLAPAGATLRPTRLSELLVTPDTGRARVHAVLRDVADAQAQLHALQAAAIARLAELQPAQEPLPGSRRNDPADADRPDDWVADEVAVVLGIGVSSAVSLVDKQRVLVEQLPQVWEELADGVIDVRRCQVLVDDLAHRKQSFGGGLPDDLVDDIARRGLRWIGEGIGPTPLADRIGGALIAADPAEADRRAERRKKKQNVTTVGCGDGLAGFRADLLDAADAAQMQAVVDAMAATMRKAGDRRPIGQLRVDAHRQLVLRPWEALPDDVARARWQLAMRVELADLDGLGSLGSIPRSAAPTADGEGSQDGPPIGTAPEPGTDNHNGRPAPTGSTSSTPRRSGDGRDGQREHGGQDEHEHSEHERSEHEHSEQGAGSGVGEIGGLSVSPVAVAELLARFDALLASGARGRVQGGDVWFEILDATGRLRALTSPAEARAALRRGTGLGPPPRIADYEPNAAQTRFVKARDRHCRFPGCARPAEYVDLDHAIPYDHDEPSAGGPTCVTNLVCLCRRHHRLKTHAPGWVFAMDPDGTLHVTPPGGRTRTTRPAGIAQVDMSTPTHLDTLTDLLGPTPKRFRSPTSEQRAARRAAAADRARLAAEIEAELDAALARRNSETRRDETRPGDPDAAGGAGSSDDVATDAADHAGDRVQDGGSDDDPPPF
ncbi:hypothetical protein [Klenkia terrae]|uniref:HNH nuclease domain-containing protein n=1 Tax=Klenkia terrae TaxID=1052259 RepID=A0ABU8E6D7_9ACTN